MGSGYRWHHRARQVSAASDLAVQLADGGGHHVELVDTWLNLIHLYKGIQGFLKLLLLGQQVTAGHQSNASGVMQNRLATNLSMRKQSLQ